MKTKWILPLRNEDSVFTITGEIGAMEAVAINPVAEPLGMVSIVKGKINSLVFNMEGTNYKGTGKATFLYSDLKLEVLKMKEAALKKKGLVSFLANTLVKNDNPKNGDTRVSDISFDRDVKKSFFNLVWKSILSGVKNAALGK